RQRKENRLRGVLGIVLVAGHAQANPEDHRRIATDDLLVRLLRAAHTELLQQFLCALLIEELSIPQGPTLVARKDDKLPRAISVKPSQMREVQVSSYPMRARP